AGGDGRPAARGAAPRGVGAGGTGPLRPPIGGCAAQERQLNRGVGASLKERATERAPELHAPVSRGARTLSDASRCRAPKRTPAGILGEPYRGRGYAPEFAD